MTDKEVRGWATTMDGKRVQLDGGAAQALLDLAHAQDKKRRDLMPDSMSALRHMTDARHRLRDEGWREAMYCPKDGSRFAVIEYGSTGIFEGTYWGEWPDGKLYVCDGFTHPHGALFKEIDALTDDERTKMEECMEADRAFAEREIAAFASDCDVERDT